MKILVSGGAGFIGSHVADGYVRAGHRVVVVDDLSGGERGNIDSACKFYEMSVTSPDFVEVIKRERPDVINHHAAQIDVRKSVADPSFDAEVNIMGMINACQGAAQAGAKKVIFASSGGVLYGEVEGEPAREDHPIEPFCPYAASKYASEIYLRCYNSLCNLRYTILRYANVYGPRQKGGEAGVVSIFLKAMLGSKPVTIFGDGRQERDFVFVGDVVDANMLALERGERDVINIGTGRASSVNDLYRLLADIVAFKGEVMKAPERQGELKRSVLSCAMAASKLGWRPKTDLRAGLIATRDWFARVR